MTELIGSQLIFLALSIQFFINIIVLEVTDWVVGYNVGYRWYLQSGRGDDTSGQVEVAPLAQDAGPQLDADDAEDEEDEEAEQEHVAQHGQSIQQQHHQDPHTFFFELHLLSYIFVFEMNNTVSGGLIMYIGYMVKV